MDSRMKNEKEISILGIREKIDGVLSGIKSKGNNLVKGSVLLFSLVGGALMLGGCASSDPLTTEQVQTMEKDNQLQKNLLEQRQKIEEMLKDSSISAEDKDTLQQKENEIDEALKNIQNKSYDNDSMLNYYMLYCIMSHTNTSNVSSLRNPGYINSFTSEAEESFSTRPTTTKTSVTTKSSTSQPKTYSAPKESTPTHTSTPKPPPAGA